MYCLTQFAALTTEIFEILILINFIILHRNEGGRGFYKGLLPSLLRVTPATAITFVVYENVSHSLQTITANDNKLKG